MSKIQEVSNAVQSGKSKIVGGLVQEALKEGYDPTEILKIGRASCRERVSIDV